MAAPGAAISNPGVTDIVARSVANNDANWKAAPQFDYKERDVITKGGRNTTRTFQVVMLDGSPYDMKLDAPASGEKLQREEARRKRESPDARNVRIASYRRERRQDHELMAEMVHAFHFRLIGHTTIDGRDCFQVEATPRPDYVPYSRETKVLSGMRGTLWVDAATYQWVKVTASVFRPVAFGLFIAHVEPGTEFTLQEAPVEGGLWMPRHFRMQVKASVLFWSRNSVDDETYWDYHRAQR
jgi:hypothetical protein